MGPKPLPSLHPHPLMDMVFLCSMGRPRKRLGGRRESGGAIIPRPIRLTIRLSEWDAEDINRIARAWGVASSDCVYWLIHGRLAELREERPDAALADIVSGWLALQSRKLGHHGVESWWARLDRKARADAIGGVEPIEPGGTDDAGS